MNEITIAHTNAQDQEEIVCILCEGTHGNNTWCQSTPEWSL